MDFRTSFCVKDIDEYDYSIKTKQAICQNITFIIKLHMVNFTKYTYYLRVLFFFSRDWIRQKWNDVRRKYIGKHLLVQRLSYGGRGNPHLRYVKDWSLESWFT